MQSVFLTGISVLGIGLSGCGPSVGNYEVTDVKTVDELPDAVRSKRDPEPYLKLTIRSPFDLVADGANIYAFKTSCDWPYSEERMIFGPLAAGDPPVDLYDAEPEMQRDIEGRAVYVLLLSVAAPARKPIPNLNEIDPAYDLRTTNSDLCLKITQAGYFITESRSEIIRVPRSDLSRVLAKLPPRCAAALSAGGNEVEQRVLRHGD